MKQVLVLGFILADLLELLASHSLRRYLDDTPLKYGLSRLVLLLIGKIKEIVLHEKFALEFSLKLHLFLAILIRITHIFLFFSIPFDHFQHIVHRDLLNNRSILSGLLDLHGLAGLSLIFICWNDDILCNIFFFLLILAEIGQRNHQQIQSIFLFFAVDLAEMSAGRLDCLLQLGQMQVLSVEGMIKCEIGRQLRRMKEGAA